MSAETAEAVAEVTFASRQEARFPFSLGRSSGLWKITDVRGLRPAEVSVRLQSWASASEIWRSARRTRSARPSFTLTSSAPS